MRPLHQPAVILALIPMDRPVPTVQIAHQVAVGNQLVTVLRHSLIVQVTALQTLHMTSPYLLKLLVLLLAWLLVFL